jgi:hypothetical protein
MPPKARTTTASTKTASIGMDRRYPDAKQEDGQYCTDSALVRVLVLVVLGASPDFTRESGGQAQHV